MRFSVWNLLFLIFCVALAMGWTEWRSSYIYMQGYEDAIKVKVVVEQFDSPRK